MPPHRILFIDAYDSFSNSIIALLRAELSVTVESIKIDDPRFVLNDEAFFAYLDVFHAVVAGPGPGHPSNRQDVGLIGKLWELPDRHVLPILGICLGFQSLCLASGAEVVRLRDPRHGIMAMISHSGNDIFAAAGKLVATQYHSLHVQLERGTGETWEPANLWAPPELCPDLLPLAWDLLNVGNGPVLMGVRHVSKPFWGVQYHPESICTNKEGQRLIGTWWKEARGWSLSQRRAPVVNPLDSVQDPLSSCKTTVSLQSLPGRKVNWTSLKCRALPNVATVVESIRSIDSPDPLVLESGTRNGKPVNAETGRFSIIGMPDASSMQVQFFTSNRILKVLHDGEVVLDKRMEIAEAFKYFDEHMRSQKSANGPIESPFWGGLMGFISYEAGLETIDVPPVGARSDRPDMWFVFVDRSIVVDHVKGVAYIQSVRPIDDEWLNATKTKLHELFNSRPPCRCAIPNVSAILVDGPEHTKYCAKVRECQRQLRAGESYELCLTDQSTLKTSATPWSLYTQLRSKNPAPFSAYLNLHSPNPASATQPISITSTSPERFLSFTRTGLAQFRPIKGTVKKTPTLTRHVAEEILSSPKERAENLMIVDLIRHDLAGVRGVSNVRVPKLMSIEEYETVFQLVSVIEGDLAPPTSGISALAASLPPGSMTGAPKKRSCELLKEIERNKPRGLYSGVIGYFDVGGGGDFSVVIRTAFKWGGDGVDEWCVGAGGAITALSEEKAEWEEMLAKRESVLNALS